MKVIFDTNVFIGLIRSEKYIDMFMDSTNNKFLSSVVLTELWMGAKNVKMNRLMEKLQKPYIEKDRVVIMSQKEYIKLGQILSDFPEKYKNKLKSSGFINDICIAFNAVSIGAILLTENKKDFELIKEYLPTLKVEYL